MDENEELRGFLRSEYDWAVEIGSTFRQRTYSQLLDMWRENAKQRAEIDALRAELDALRANFAEVAGVDLPETGEGE